MYKKYKVYTHKIFGDVKYMGKGMWYIISEGFCVSSQPRFIKGLKL